MTIRSATADDRPFLERTLAVAADWRPGSSVRPVEQVLADPHLARYVDLWPAPGEFGVIAEDEHGHPVGAAWCRYCSAERPGYGFVAAEAPEVSIGEVAERVGVATSALRYSEHEGLIRSQRNEAGHRRYRRDVLRRVSFIRTAQRCASAACGTRPTSQGHAGPALALCSTRSGPAADEIALLRSGRLAIARPAATVTS